MTNLREIAKLCTAALFIKQNQPEQATKIITELLKASILDLTIRDITKIRTVVLQEYEQAKITD